MTKYSWIKKPLDKNEIREVSCRYNISLLESSILMRRNLLEPEQLLYFLENHAIFLHNPFLFKEMTTAVDRISQAILTEEKIGIFGDSDADGICSTTLLVEYLRNKKNNPIFLVPQGFDSHGITSKVIEDFHQKGITLIVCLDNGSNSNHIFKKASELHIDVIIIDHHSVKERPSYAYACINPILEEDYKNNHLSASVLVLKFLQALDFSTTSYYKKPFCIIVIQEKNKCLDIELLFIENLLIKHSSTFLLHKNNEDLQKFLDSIQGNPLYSFDVKNQCTLFKKFFHADIYIEELKNYLGDSLKKIREKSLEKLHNDSSLCKFFPSTTYGETLLSLFRLIVFCDKNLLPNFWKGFDLATIGLVSDMMPMCDENRIITKIGLKQLKRPHRTSLILLLTHLNLLENPIDTHTVGWQIGPIINSSGRMGEAQQPIHFFLSQTHKEQEKYLQNILELHYKRKNLTDLWIEKISQQAHNSHECSKGFSLFVYTEDLPRGFTGLLANRLRTKFPQSLIVIAAKGSDDHISASLRSNRNSLILPFLRKNAKLFTDYGGHERAGGFVAKASVQNKIKKIVESFTPENTEENQKDSNEIYVDAELSSHNFSQEIFTVIDKFMPYGQRFEPLVFMTCDSLITKIQLIGKLSQHLKLTLKIDNHLYTAIWWQKSGIAEFLILDQKIDILYNIVNSSYFFNKLSLQIIDLKIPERQ